MQLLHNNLLVLPDPIRDDITSSGILVAAAKPLAAMSAEQLGFKGTVVICGDDIDKDQINAGDRILFGEFNYPEHYVDGVKHFILSDQDVCGVIEE